MTEQTQFNAVTVVGIGKAIPDKVLTNDDLSKIVDTSDEWIRTRTGIGERRVVSGNETACSLALKAAQDALGFAELDASSLDMIITATSTPDNLYPSVSCEVQTGLGIDGIPAFDVTAACSGLIYGINIANSFIKTGACKTILVIGVDVHSRFIDWTDRGTCVLFGDGAGAVILQKSEDGINDILAIDIHADGKKASELKIPLSGKNCPLVEPNEIKPQFVSMNGREIYKFAVSVVPDSILKALESAGLTIEDLNYLIPHQANMRIVSAITERLNLKEEQVIVNLEKYGNTSTASVPIALSEALEDGKINNSAVTAICGFGAGLTWGTAIIRWRAKDKRKG